MHERESAREHDAEGSEEGEIVDSEEEKDMIQRIRELEAKNDELEKIASISGDYTNQYSFAESQTYKSRVQNLNAKKTLLTQKDVARIPSDASSISSDEMEIVKKRTKRKGRHLKKDYMKSRLRSSSSHKHVHRSHKFESNLKFPKPLTLCQNQKKMHLRKESSPIVVNDNYLEIISLDSDEDSDHQIVDLNDSDCDNMNTPFQLNRDKLRLALVHDKTNESKKNCNLLRERLCNGNSLIEQKENFDTCAMVQDSGNENHISEPLQEQCGKEECVTPEEQELRLIALKSAVLKKHLARKKRNAEMAYSPTDFAPVPVNYNIADDNMDVVEEELDELNDVMDISPINSPKLVLSPCYDEEQNHNDVKDVGNNYSIDMDISKSGSEEEFDHVQSEQWYPIETPPMTSHVVDPKETLKYPLPVHYAIYVPEMQYQYPPLSVKSNENRDVIDNRNEMFQSKADVNENLSADEEPPPPPSMFLKNVDHKHVMSSPKALNSFSDTFIGDKPTTPSPLFSDFTKDTIKSNDLQWLTRNDKTEQHSAQSSKQSQQDVKDEGKDSDEEVSALRAVLLSKLQASKIQKKGTSIKDAPETFLPNLRTECHPKDNSNKNGVESILQKALRRLKSNLNSPPLNVEEHDNRIVEVKNGCLYSTTVVTEITSRKMETKEQEMKNRGHLNVEIESEHSTNETEYMSSELPDTVERINENISSISSMAEKANVHQTEEENNFPREKYEERDSKAHIGSEIIDEDSRSITEKSSVEKVNSYSQSNHLVCFKKDQKMTKTKESMGAVSTQSQTSTNSLLPANVSSNENSRTRETKEVKSVSPLTPLIRVQPLSSKNNLLPAKTVSFKSSKMLVQTTIPKMRTTRTTKIVRRNKVINKEITTKIKRAQAPGYSPPLKILPNNSNSTSTPTNKSATASDTPPNVRVNKLVICLRASDTETSDDEILKEVVSSVDDSFDREKNTYSEIASPLELNMNSSNSSPARGKSLPLIRETSLLATKEKTESKTNAGTNAAFEQKLDAFLKDIRKKGSVETSVNNYLKSSPPKKVENSKSFNTPSAVRHLPLASQDEYRRLVHRMTLLEKQKQNKKSDDNSKSPEQNSKQIPLRATSCNHEEKTAAIRKVELKTLLSYENAFELTSDNILRLLNKSLSLVAEAKKAKIAKLRYEKRLQELRAEVVRVQTLFGKEEQKFSRLKPQIGASNQFLTTLKKKRRNLMENANKLGRSLQGDKYSLSNKMGEEIIKKSRKLHAEIKLVNILKTENIEPLLSASKSTKDCVDDQLSVKAPSFQLNSKKDCQIEERCPKEHLADADTFKGNPNNCDDKEPISTKQHPLESSQKEMDPQEHCIDQNVMSVEPAGEKSTENQNCERAVWESEKLMEQEVQHEDNTARDMKDNIEPTMNNGRIVPVYKSPLDHFRHEYRNIDNNAIVCPFEMWGKCADGNCSYMHMTMGRKRGSELTFKPVNAENL